MSRDELYQQIKSYLVDVFEVPADKVTPDARLYEDLDLDSIDAVDLIVKLQDLTDQKFKPDDFKSARTVADVADRVDAMMKAQA
ncbi:acyl carrier protein [Bosea caraganae]|uniref:Acyl carrier protein n=1 Tax=Bosea caraganae TaxID=2763117 RepID=A0A370L8F5_9HYPH|nr:acyl carrier protein [Bosea caraganae]RDJ25217.1 acyl carrier protein [Bosea caraganae]RDJ26327.1 acyl carrier protein [Bosea caraganae]